MNPAIARANIATGAGMPRPSTGVPVKKLTPWHGSLVRASPLPFAKRGSALIAVKSA